MKFTETHEWIKVESKDATIGITKYAQKELGEIVFIELPKVGTKIKSGEEVAVLESTKAAADIYSPVSGEITEVNDKLKEDLSLINNSPESEGWIFKAKLIDATELEKLYSEEGYSKLVEQ